MLQFLNLSNLSLSYKIHFMQGVQREMLNFVITLPHKAAITEDETGVKLYQSTIDNVTPSVCLVAGHLIFSLAIKVDLALQSAIWIVQDPYFNLKYRNSKLFSLVPT